MDGSVADGGSSQRIKHQFIDVAPAPILAKFKRLNNRMARIVEVSRRVFVGRRIAATDVAASHAQAQVQPLVADAKAIFTTAGARRHRPDLIEVRTNLCHGVSPFRNCGSPYWDRGRLACFR